MPRRGAEQSQNIAGNSAIEAQDDALSDARRDLCQFDDARLAKLIDAWPALADDVKGQILTLAGLRANDADDLNGVTAALPLSAVPESGG